MITQNAQNRVQDSAVNTSNNKRPSPSSGPSGSREKPAGEANEVAEDANEQEEIIEEGEDAGVFCNICLRGESNEDNLIVMCEGQCGLAFHQGCYGIHDIPPGDEPWYCDWCAGGNRKSYGKYLYCCHYKNDRSARDLIVGDRETPVHYVHVQCAAWIGHIDTTKIPFKTDVKKVKAEDGRCYFCDARYGGYQAHCSHFEEGIRCKSSFHPMCAIRNRYLAPPTRYSVKYANDYCPEHNPDPDPDPPNMKPQTKMHWVIKTDITNTGGECSSPNIGTRSSFQTSKQNGPQAHSRRGRVKGSARGSRTGRSKEGGAYPLRTLRRHSMQPAFTMNRISGTVAPQLIDDKVENQTIILDSDGEIKEPPTKRNRPPTSQTANGNIGGVITVSKQPPAVSASGMSGTPVKKRITPQTTGISNLPHTPRPPTTPNVIQGSQRPFSSPSQPHPQPRPQFQPPRTQPHLQLRPQIQSQARPRPRLRQSAPSIPIPVQEPISVPAPLSASAAITPMSASDPVQVSTAVPAAQPATVPIPTLTPPLSSSVAEHSTTAVSAVSEMSMPGPAQVQSQVAPATAVPTQQPQVAPANSAQTQTQPLVLSTASDQTQHTAPGLAKIHTIRIKPFTPGMSPTIGSNLSSTLLSEDQATLLKESHGMLENQSTVLRSIQNMVKQMSVSSSKRPQQSSGVRSGNMDLGSSHAPPPMTEPPNVINSPQQLQALNSTFGINIPGSTIHQQQQSGVLSSSEMDSLTMQSQLTAAAATAELEEMKANIVYLLKKVNMPQILLNSLMPQFEGQSNSGGSSSERRGLLQRNKAFKDLVDKLKKIGSFSKDNVHEYIKVFVRGLEMADEVNRNSVTPSSPSPSSSST